MSMVDRDDMPGRAKLDVAALMARLGESVTGHRSFGPAFEKDGVLVVPVAYVFGGGGGGEGQEPDKRVEAPPKTGFGGGFGLVSWPIGAYVVQDGQVRWIPVVDPALMITAGGVALATVLRAMRRRKRRRRRD
jgi:uncharacterized spore protein YtfJ